MKNIFSISRLSLCKNLSIQAHLLVPFTAIWFALCLGNIQAATNFWDGNSGLRPEQMRYRWAFLKPTIVPEPTFTNGILTIVSDISLAHNVYYVQSGEVIAMPPRVVAQTEMRLVSMTGQDSSSRAPADVSVVTQPGVGNGIWIGPGEIWLGSVDGGAKGPSAKVDTQNAFHTYRLEIDGLTNGSPIRVYYDGALTLTGTTYYSLYLNGNTPLVAWGDGTSHAAGISEWRSFQHNAAAFPAVWGVKSSESPFPSGNPATLFHFAEDGSGLTAVGPVTLGGAQIDVDGLALGANGTLYGFQISLPGSRLVKIDKSTAVATTMGPILTNREIRGAVYTLAGQIWALDAAQKRVLAVDPATGEALGSGVPLQGPLDAGKVADVCDLAQAHDGSLMMTWNHNEFYALNPFTGAMPLLRRDPVVDRQGGIVTLAGLAFSRDATNPAIAFAYEISLQDDIYTYQTDADFARAVPYMNLIGSYNAGRGDLASLPPMDCQITSFDYAPHSQSIRAGLAGNLHAWVEWSQDLSPTSWSMLPNSTVTPDPDSGDLYRLVSWSVLSTAKERGFFRVGAALQPPVP